MDQSSVNPESPTKAQEPTSPKPKIISHAAKPPQDLEVSVEMTENTSKKGEGTQIKAEMPISISESPKASDESPRKEIHSAKPIDLEAGPLNRVLPDMSPGPAHPESEPPAVEVIDFGEQEQMPEPEAEQGSDQVERVNAQVQVNPRDYDLEEPSRQERILDHFDPISILEPDDQDLHYDHLKRQAQTRYCMVLMIYILVFNLFFLRRVTLKTEGIELLSEEKGAYRHSPATFLRMMKVYEFLNMGEYGLTVIYLLVSLLFFDRTHNVVGSHKFLRPFLLYSWILNIGIQVFGTYCLWNKDATPLAKSSPLLETHYLLVENMIGIRMACYFILSTAVVVFFCLYGCFVVMTNRLDFGIDQRPDSGRSERKLKALVAHLQKIAKDYYPRGVPQVAASRSPTNQTVPVFPDDPDYPDQCTICFKDFISPNPVSSQEPNTDNSEERRAEKVVELACSRKHVYHLKCLTEWVHYSDICPICKQQISMD